MSELIAELSHVGLKFGSYVVHKDISLQIFKGDTITILGPSGSGKTIILKLLMALLSPTSGNVRIMGNDLAALEETELRDIRRNIGMLFQGAALFDSLTVYENIAFSLREAGEESESTIEEVVKERLEVVGLPGIEQKYPPQLSGGQKKRVGLARALASSPKLMLFDEPTTGLDPTATRLIDDLIVKLRTEMGITSVVVTHDIESAKRVSNRWALINEGSIIADGPVDALLRESPKVHDFVTGNWND